MYMYNGVRIRVQNSSQHFGHPCRRFFTQEIEKK